MGPRFIYPGRAHFRKSSAVIILLLTVWTHGCGDTSRDTKGVEGTWQRHIVSGTATFVGLLTLGPDGSFSFTFEGNAVGHERSDGRYSLSGRDIKFENKSCKGVGRYRYLVKDSTLAFIPLADGCARRKAMLTGKWLKRDEADTIKD